MLSKTDASTGDDRNIPLARASTVFNAAQVDGYDDGTPDLEALPPMQRNDQAEAFFRNTGAHIEEGGDSAFYRPSTDTIHMPDRARFVAHDVDDATNAYLAVLSHEAVHWSGTATRCARDLTGRFGSDQYAMEELVLRSGVPFFARILGWRSRHAKTTPTISRTGCA